MDEDLLADAKEEARRLIDDTEITADELVAYLAYRADVATGADITEARDEHGLEIGLVGNGAYQLRQRVEEAMEGRV